MVEIKVTGNTTENVLRQIVALAEKIEAKEKGGKQNDRREKGRTDRNGDAGVGG